MKFIRCGLCGRKKPRKHLVKMDGWWCCADRETCRDTYVKDIDKAQRINGYRWMPGAGFVHGRDLA